MYEMWTTSSVLSHLQIQFFFSSFLSWLATAKVIQANTKATLHLYATHCNLLYTPVIQVEEENEASS